MIAANRHAVALADTGQPHPAILIVSLSRAGAPEEVETEALRDLSDLVHACHATWDRRIPSNEEWCYAPHGANARMPLHLVIKWRLNITAGFEGATGIHINPLPPHALRDRIISELRKLRDDGKVAPVQIGEESSISADCLDY